jgi:hypothetical protein
MSRLVVHAGILACLLPAALSASADVPSGHAAAAVGQAPAGARAEAARVDEAGIPAPAALLASGVLALAFASRRTRRL